MHVSKTLGNEPSRMPILVLPSQLAVIAIPFYVSSMGFAMENSRPMSFLVINRAPWRRACCKPALQ